MSETKIENAQITDTTLGIEGHGIMTAMIGLSGEGWGVGFGGYTFDQWDETQKRRVGVDYGMEFIMRVLHVVGVDSWEKLKGRHVRVVTEGWGGRALKIGHITKDRWFDPQALSDEMRARHGWITETPAPDAMPEIRIGDVVEARDWQGDYMGRAEMFDGRLCVYAEGGYISLATKDILSVYREPLWRRQEARP